MGSAGITQRIMNWISAEDLNEEEEIMDTKSTSDKPYVVSQQKSSKDSINGAQKFRVRTDQTMQIYHPRTLDEREKIADSLKNRAYVTLDLTRLPDPSTRKSFFDFVCGVVYGLDANISLITEGVYAIMPYGMEISNDDLTGMDFQSEQSNPLKEASIFNTDLSSWMGKRQ